MKKTILFLSISLVFAFNGNTQSVITIDNSIGANAQYSDLQTAIDAAAN